MQMGTVLHVFKKSLHSSKAIIFFKELIDNTCNSDEVDPQQIYKRRRFSQL